MSWDVGPWWFGHVTKRMTHDPDTPVEILATDECWALLRSTEVGRLAVAIMNKPDIFPVNYLVDHGAVVFRTAEGTKLAAAYSGKLLRSRSMATTPCGARRGALGVTDDTILSHWYRHERAARIYDGADEVHETTLGRHILRRYATA
jgi:alkylation response protein AidB-like acyl-CoA dehydrogenase